MRRGGQGVGVAVLAATLLGSVLMAGTASADPDSSYPPIPEHLLRSHCKVASAPGWPAGTEISCSALPVPQREWRTSVICHSPKVAKAPALGNWVPTKGGTSTARCAPGYSFLMFETGMR